MKSSARKAQERFSGGPLPAGLRTVLPEKAMGRKKDAFSVLEEMAAGRDSAGVAAFCAYLEEASLDSPLSQVAQWMDMLSALASEGRRRLGSDVLQVVSASAGSLRERYGKRALAMDIPPHVKPRGRAPDDTCGKEADGRLLQAAGNGDLEGVKKALMEGADVHAQDSRGSTAMALAMGDEVYFDLAVPRHRQVVDFLFAYLHER